MPTIQVLAQAGKRGGSVAFVGKFFIPLPGSVRPGELTFVSVEAEMRGGRAAIRCLGLDAQANDLKERVEAQKEVLPRLIEAAAAQVGGGVHALAKKMQDAYVFALLAAGAGADDVYTTTYARLGSAKTVEDVMGLFSYFGASGGPNVRAKNAIAHKCLAYARSLAREQGLADDQPVVKPTGKYATSNVASSVFDGLKAVLSTEAAVAAAHLKSLSDLDSDLQYIAKLVRDAYLAPPNTP
ncbi:hypothetical protein [Deinococcus sp. S9]|uniref:hypothetical protein n=1 Tax=Deinococcus sp. S9 TaxID=2545754 RepID=UPI0010541620|nr:hypothetical protein [Deinococcus sp. S9]TDE87423.1 hypothetical protein E0686_02715 [Deinococcus sp. S9]